MPRFPFEYCSAYSPISTRKLRTVWRFDSPGKWWIVMEIESETDKMLRSYWSIGLIFTEFDITSTYEDMNKKRTTKDRVPYPTYGSRIIEEINKRWNNQILSWFLFWWIAQPQRYWINLMEFEKSIFQKKNERTLRFSQNRNNILKYVYIRKRFLNEY